MTKYQSVEDIEAEALVVDSAPPRGRTARSSAVAGVLSMLLFAGVVAATSSSRSPPSVTALQQAADVTECSWDANEHLNVTFDDRRRLLEASAPSGDDETQRLTAARAALSAAEGAATAACYLFVYKDVEATLSLKKHFAIDCGMVEWGVGGSFTDGACSTNYTCTATGKISAYVVAGDGTHPISLYCA
jgi:hypothetical protein